jgi:hypothetical protein
MNILQADYGPKSTLGMSCPNHASLLGFAPAASVCHSGLRTADLLIHLKGYWISSKAKDVHSAGYFHGFC